MRKTFRSLIVTGVLAGFTLTAMASAQAAGTDAVKNTKIRLLDTPQVRKTVRGEKDAVKKSEVKAWKRYGKGFRTGSERRYLGIDKTRYGSKQSCDRKMRKNDCAKSQQYRTGSYSGKYSGRFYRPADSRSYDSFRPYYPGGYRVSSAQSASQCKHMAPQSGHHKCCCCR